ncbi:MAG: DUF805 domain-containing protein [Proteobacteria bacterium]|nr:DUF805 domain-containing protein [Pseudomonadota bacterium]
MNAPAAPRIDLADDPMPPWRLWLDPRGRIDRATFWRGGVLALLGIALLLRALLDIARWPPDEAEQWVSLLMAWPTAAVSAKRWHDRDRSAWWVLLLLLPVVGVVWLLADNGFVRGSEGPNRYGPPPAEA